MSFLFFFSQVADPFHFLFIFHYYPPHPKKDKLSRPLINFFLYPIIVREQEDLSCIKINNKEYHYWSKYLKSKLHVTWTIDVPTKKIKLFHT